MMPRTVNAFSPSAVCSGRRLPTRSPLRSASSFETMSESGCARKTSGSSTIAVVSAVEVVVAQTAIARHVDAEHEQVALALQVRIHDGLDDRDRHAHGRRGLDLLEHVFAEASFAGGDLQVRLAGNAIDRSARRRGARSGSRCASRRTPRCQGRPGRGQHRAQQMALGRTASSRGRAVSPGDVLGDPAVPQRDVRSQLSRHVGVVGDDHDRGAEARVEVANEREDVLAGPGVEVAGGLVGEQDRAGRSTAPARWRPAAAVRPRARPAGAAHGRPAGPASAVRVLGPRPSVAATRAGAAEGPRSRGRSGWAAG